MGAVFEVELPEIGREVEPAHDFLVVPPGVLQVKVRKRSQGVVKRATGLGGDNVFCTERDVELSE